MHTKHGVLRFTNAEGIDLCLDVSLTNLHTVVFLRSGPKYLDSWAPAPAYHDEYHEYEYINITDDDEKFLNLLALHLGYIIKKDDP